MEKKVILASGSPRRRDLMQKLGVPFEVVPSAYEEVLRQGSDPEELAMELALGKAEDVASRLKEGIVVGSDTLIAFEGEILGKPKSPEEAIAVLKRLRGKDHLVITAVAVIDISSRRKEVFADKATVQFKPIADEEIEAYVATGEPLDRAASYAIQGGAAPFIERFEGDFDSIVGLPVGRLRLVLKEKFGI